MCATAGQACPYLGRCEDPENYYFFPTVDNCCHTEKRPSAIQPAYQARVCLRGDWAACVRYRAATGVEVGEDSVVISPPLPLLRRSLSAKIIGGILVVGVILLVVLFLIFRPGGDSSQPLPVTSSPTPSREEMTAAAGPAHPSSSPTILIGGSDDLTKVAPPSSASPTLTASSTWTPTSTPTSTRTPTATATRRPTHPPTATTSQSPTPTPSSTSTQTPAPGRTPTDTPAPTARPTRRPTATKRPTATSTPLPAPVLLAPRDGAVFSRDAEIVLEWQPLAGLPDDGYYAITVVYSHRGETWYDEVPWTRDTSWTLSEHNYLLDLSDDGRFWWSVQAIRRTGVDAAGNPVGETLSLSSDVWTLDWMRAGDGDGEPTQSPGQTPPPPPTPMPPPP